MCVTVTQNVTVSREPEAPSVPLTRREMKDLYLRANARKPHPSPVCRSCGMPFMRGDADPFDRRVCCTCGVNRTEKRVRRLLRARSKKARKRALRRLLALAPKK